MNKPVRVLWPPTVAILLPCAFVGLLGYQWLALEREASGHRSVDAAKAAALALGRDLRDDLRVAAAAAAGVLDDFAAARPPFQPLAPLPALIGDAYAFNGSRELLAPDYEARAHRAINDYRLASANPSWQRSLSRLQTLEASGRIEDALRSAGELFRQAETSGLRASALLALARLSYASGRTAAAEQHAAQIQACCRDARDEYGTSFVLYAAWQRAAWYARSPIDTPRLTRLASEIREAVDLGYFGRAEDVTALSLLAQRASRSSELADLVQRVAGIHKDVSRRIETALLAARWLSTADVPEGGDPAPFIGIARQEGVPSIIVVSRTGADRLIVMVVDADGLAARIAAWAARHAAFDMTMVHGPSARPPEALLMTPLFAGVTGYDLVVRQRAADPATDRRRERLFISALVAALTLALFIGYLAVRDVTRELDTATLRANFIAGVSHELKTPLSSIRLLAETLREGRARPDTSRELLDTIVEESDRLTRLVDNVLTSSRIDSGVRVYHSRPISLPDVVRSALHRFELVVKQEGFTLTERIDDGDLQVAADPDALERTVLNLLGNAVKYSGAKRSIRVSVGRRDGHGEVIVADEGMGVAASEHGRIFESFYRSPAAAAHTAGAGLGLALARHFAEAHDGRISVQSRPGEGSTFTISLPLLNHPAADHGAHSDR